MYLLLAVVALVVAAVVLALLLLRRCANSVHSTQIQLISSQEQPERKGNLES
jgi:outer membrane murein-binding lipoprotein Lpp